MTRNPRTTALVTGASSGIGAIYADRLARRGFDLILVARNAARLTTVAEAATRHGVAVETMRLDLADPADLGRVEARLRSDEAIRMMVNNAGINAVPSMVGADPDALERMIRINITVPTRLAAVAATAFAAAGGGALINISSALALMPELFSGAYSGSKAFLLNLSLSLAKELAPCGVRVQAVLPGATATAFWSGSEGALPTEMVMAAEELVDAALTGFDAGEEITIPSLPDPADWDAFNEARSRLGPNLSHQHAALRYRQTT